MQPVSRWESGQTRRWTCGLGLGSFADRPCLCPTGTPGYHLMILTKPGYSRSGTMPILGRHCCGQVVSSPVHSYLLRMPFAERPALFLHFSVEMASIVKTALIWPIHHPPQPAPLPH